MQEGRLTSYSGKTTHSVTTLSIDFDSTCSNRLGNELNVESVPLNLETTNPRPARAMFSHHRPQPTNHDDGRSDAPMNENHEQQIRW